LQYYPHSFPTRRSSDLYSAVIRCKGKQYYDKKDTARHIFSNRTCHHCICHRYICIKSAHSINGFGCPSCSYSKILSCVSRIRDRSEEHTSELQSRFDLV